VKVSSYCTTVRLRLPCGYLMEWVDVQPRLCIACRSFINVNLLCGNAKFLIQKLRKPLLDSSHPLASANGVHFHSTGGFICPIWN